MKTTHSKLILSVFLSFALLSFANGQKRAIKEKADRLTETKELVTVKGTVTAFNNYYVNNAEITSRRTRSKTITDSLGKFEIMATCGDVLVFRANGFEKNLEIVGVGYRAEKSGEKLTIRVGYSHPVTITPLPGVSLEVEGANRIKVTGISKEVVGEMAAEIRAIRPPDRYKGKGIRYAGEVVHLKAGKAGKAIGKKK